TRSPSTRRSNWPSRSAAPTASSSSTGCSTNWPPMSARTRCGPRRRNAARVDPRRGGPAGVRPRAGMETILASEFDLIARYFTRPAPAGMLGVGDDCALFPAPAGMHIATSTDLLIQGRHFFPDVDPAALGHKALAVNLSDLAAMGARPIGCVLGLALPQASESWLAGFAQGFHGLADRHGCPLMGGDTTRSPHDLAISVTVFGAVAPERALRRDAARAGDDIWVSGALGAADVAYRLLDGQLPADPQRLAATRRALEWPEPRVALGQALGGLARAAIDISDGLLQDLAHVLEASGVGAHLAYE